MSLNWEMSVKLFTTYCKKNDSERDIHSINFWGKGDTCCSICFFSRCDVSSTIVCLFTLPLDILLCLSLFNLAAIHLSECLYQDRLVNY